MEGFDDNMKPIFNHFVMIDPYHITRSFVTEQEKAQGYFYKLVDGLHTKCRYICIPCFGEQETTRHYRESMKRELAKNGENKELRNSFYVQEMMLNSD